MTKTAERAHAAQYDLSRASEHALLAFWATDPIYLNRHLEDLDKRFRAAAKALGYDLIERVTTHEEAAALMPEQPTPATPCPTISELDAESMRERAMA